jgi:hypothetical protein
MGSITDQRVTAVTIDGQDIPAAWGTRTGWITAAPGHPRVICWHATWTAHRAGHITRRHLDCAAEPPDLAGDLSHAPQLQAIETAGDQHGTSEWTASALGFTDTEADHAARALATALASPWHTAGDDSAQ